jgi:hypothetical protein
MTSTDPRRRQVSGRGIPVPGHDIDTDRIIPARFLKEVTFESMGEHAFEDARHRDAEHPFSQKAYQGAAVLVVGQNFGCGSSREQAPQALMRWGIRAIVGGSFGDIFFGNCVVLGIPCLVAKKVRRPRASDAGDGGCGKAGSVLQRPCHQGDPPRRSAPPALGRDVGFDGDAARCRHGHRGDGEEAALHRVTRRASPPAGRRTTRVTADEAMASEACAARGEWTNGREADAIVRLQALATRLGFPVTLA